MSDHDKSNTQAALDYARKTTEPLILTLDVEGDRQEVLVTRDAHGDTTYESARSIFSDLIKAPPRRKGTVTVHDLTSFVAAVNRDSNDGSAIFADANRRALTAVLDWHNPGRDARWAQDRIVYGFELSHALAAWIEASRRPMDQKTFARLIDDRLSDIAAEEPPPGSVAAEFAARRGIRFATIADLVVFTRTIAAKSATDSEEIYDDNTGDVSVQYKKKNDVKTPDGKPVTVPPAFCLRIPIFRGIGATEYAIAVRLRFDIADGRIAWRVELNALDTYLLAAMEEAIEIVRHPKVNADAKGLAAPVGCGLPVFMAEAPPAG